MTREEAGGIKHICKHFGIDRETVLQWAHPPSEDILFYTGGGDVKKAQLALTVISEL